MGLVVVSCGSDAGDRTPANTSGAAGDSAATGGSEPNPSDSVAGSTDQPRAGAGGTSSGGADRTTPINGGAAGEMGGRGDTGGGNVTSGGDNGSGGDAPNGTPDGWMCDAAHYASNDGCDCGCGALDADCDYPVSAACDRMDDAGSCVTLGGTLDDTHAWACMTCGNGVASLDEWCDGTDFAGQNCTNIGADYSGGSLLCTSACDLDLSACEGSPHETFCTDQTDNDKNRSVDCADPSCQGSTYCAPGNTPVGQPCVESNECQAAGGDPLCLTFYFPGGACSEWCDLVTPDCTGAGICLHTDPTLLQGMCFPPCDPQAEGACRTGYTCCADFDTQQFACMPIDYVGYWCTEPP